MNTRLPDNPEYGSSLDGDVYCRQCRKNDYTDEDDGLCDKCREANEPKEKRWFRVFAFPSLKHICDVTADSAEVVYDPRIGGDGNIVVQPLDNPKPEPDFRVDNHGSIFILTGLTEACREWIKANVGDDQTQTWGKHGIVVEHRFIADIVSGLQSEGFIGS